MSSRQDRSERKQRAIAIRTQLEELGLNPKTVAQRTGWSDSYLSRAWNTEESKVAPSPELLKCLEDLLQERKLELGGIVDRERLAVTMLDTCNGAMANLCAETREGMAQGLRSRLFPAAVVEPAAPMLPDHIAGAMFKLDDGRPETSVYVMVVRSGNGADELATISHELQDLSDAYALRAKKMRKLSGATPARPLPRAEY